MSILVEQQDETVDAVQEAAAHVEKDTEAGTGHTNQAVSSARAARKKRWICFGLFVLLLIIVAIIIAVVVLNNKKSERFSIRSRAVPKLTDYCRTVDIKRSSWSRHHTPTFLLMHALHKVVRNPPFLLTTLGDVILSSAFPFEYLSPSLFMSFCRLRVYLSYVHLFHEFNPPYTPKSIGFTQGRVHQRMERNLRCFPKRYEY